MVLVSSSDRYHCAFGWGSYPFATWIHGFLLWGAWNYLHYTYISYVTNIYIYMYVPLMEEILHQLLCGLPHYLQVFDRFLYIPLVQDFYHVYNMLKTFDLVSACRMNQKYVMKSWGISGCLKKTGSESFRCSALHGGRRLKHHETLKNRHGSRC